MRTPALAAVLLMAACSSGSGTTASSPSPSLTASPSPSATAAQASATPTVTLSTSPAPRRTASPTPSPTRSPTPSPKPSTTNSPSRVAKTYPISAVSGNRFSPTSLTLRRGDSVLVTNKDSRDHDFTIAALGKGSGTMAQGDTYGLTFTSTGSFDFVCTIHRGMDGTVRVTA